MNNHKKIIQSATISLAFGIISVFTMFVPVINILTSIVALYFSKESIKHIRIEKYPLNEFFIISLVGFMLGALTMLKHIMYMSSFSLILTNLLSHYI